MHHIAVDEYVMDVLLPEQVYAATHSAAHLKPQSAAHTELLATLDTEAKEEDV